MVSKAFEKSMRKAAQKRQCYEWLKVQLLLCCDPGENPTAVAVISLVNKSIKEHNCQLTLSQGDL